jgi:hypothetical protein
MEAHNSFNPASKPFYRVIFEIFPTKNREMVASASKGSIGILPVPRGAWLVPPE